jgi:hypothetical protein
MFRTPVPRKIEPLVDLVLAGVVLRFLKIADRHKRCLTKLGSRREFFVFEILRGNEVENRIAEKDTGFYGCRIGSTFHWRHGPESNYV